MSGKNFDDRNFIAMASDFRRQVEEAGQVLLLRDRAMARIGEAAVYLVALAREGQSGQGPILTARISERLIEICAADRHLLFVSVCGVGSDAHLSLSRDQPCAQIWTYFHLSGQKRAHFVGALRVYQDRSCTDGRLSWDVEGDLADILPSVAGLVEQRLLKADIYWPHEADVHSDWLNMELGKDPPLLSAPCLDFKP